MATVIKVAFNKAVAMTSLSYRGCGERSVIEGSGGHGDHDHEW